MDVTNNRFKKKMAKQKQEKEIAEVSNKSLVKPDFGIKLKSSTSSIAENRATSYVPAAQLWPMDITNDISNAVQ